MNTKIQNPPNVHVTHGVDETDNAVDPSAPDPQSLDALCLAIGDASSIRRAWKLAADWIATTFDARFVLIEIDGRSGSSTVTSDFCTDDTWEPLCDALILKARQNQQIVSKQEPDGLSVVAVPMSADDSHSPKGAVAIAIETKSTDEFDSKTRELLAYVKVCEATIQSRTNSTRQSESTGVAMQQGVSQAGSYRSLHHYAFAITNGLQAKFGCDEVAIGMLRNSQVRILSVSGMDSLHPRSPGSKLMQQAMEEAADADSCIVSPNNQSQTNLVDLPLHQQWLQESTSSSVASLPLHHDGNVIGVVSLRRTDGTTFSEEELSTATKLTSPLAAGLLLLDQANRSLPSHARQSLTTLRSKWKSLRAKTRAVVWISVSVLIGWMLFGQTTYRVQVPCQIVAGEPVQIAAPFDSRIVKAHVKPGDFVKAGAPLVEFEINTLQAEHDRLRADIRVAEIALVDALSLRDIGSAGRARNEANAARTQLAVVNRQMSQAIITAPFDGFVLDGDVQQRRGEMLAIGTEIMQFAAADKLSVELRVAEADATYVSEGMTGEFNTIARPGESWACEVNRIDASGTVVEGENVFIARANPGDNVATWLRPGMQGLAKVDAGTHPVWWVYLHGATDWLSLQAWKL
ncbi:MAG: HlyD family efflux transporter periplasmic adaptor subunit [Planctomycetaceae bacterium]